MIFLEDSIGRIDIGESIKEENSIEKTEIQQDKGNDKVLVYIIIGTVFVFIILLSYLFLFSKPKVITIDELHNLNLQGKLDEKQGYPYNGYSFVKFDNLWYFQAQSKKSLWDIAIRFGPKEIEHIPIEGFLNDTFLNASEIYMTFDPLGIDLQFIGLAIGEMDQSLIKAFGKMPIAACDKNETDICQTRPIITCENTDKAVIYFKRNATMRVKGNGNCLVIQGQGLDIVKAVDRALMEMYGIIT